MLLNLLNRALIILLALGGMLLGILLIIVPKPLLQTAQTVLGGLQRSVGEAPALFVLLGMATLGLALLVILVEVWRPPRRTVRVERVSGGQAEVALDSIAQRLEYRLDRLPDVIKVRPAVSAARQGAVNVRLEVETSLDVNVPVKTEEVIVIAREELEERMGLRLHQLRVNIRHAVRRAEPPALNP